MELIQKKYKIALIGHGLGTGGGEKAMANLSIFFESVGIEVHNIIVLDDVTYDYAGQLLNLGKLKNEANDWKSKIKRLLVLRNYLKENAFDFIIDFRSRTKHFQEFLLSRFVFDTKTIYTIHSSLTSYYIPDNVWLARLLYQKCYANVTLVKSTEKFIEDKYALTNLVTIPNPVDINEISRKSNEENGIDFEFIVAVGQMNSNVKQFDKLIESYSQSILPVKNIHLLILGEGIRKKELTELAKDKNLDNKIHFLGYQNNPYRYMRQAKFFVMSSLNEGMPNVLLEALVCGIPIVSFDCPTGPREIVEDGFNGLLVENQNVEKLSEAMSVFVIDDKLYNYCKQSAFQSVQKYSLENIGKQWLHLMKINNNN